MTTRNEGWMPVDTKGQVWSYQDEEGKGTLYIQQTETGGRIYEAEYRSETVRDARIATRDRDEALRFATTGKDVVQDTLDEMEAEGLVEVVLRPFSNEHVYRATRKGVADLPVARLTPVRHAELEAASPV